MKWLRWAPSGIAGRIALIVVGAVIVAQVLTGAFFYWTRPVAPAFEPSLAPAAGHGLPGPGGGPGTFWPFGPGPGGPAPPSRSDGVGAAAIRLAGMAHALDAEPALAVGELAPLLRRFGFSVQATADHLGEPAAAEGPAAAAAAILARELGDRGRRIRVAQREATPGVARVVLGVELHDHRWLIGEVQGWEIMPPPSGMFRPSVLLPLMFLVVTIILVSAWVTRRVTAPLQSFAEAAERLGTEGSTPHLPETGPAEVRRAALAFNRMQDRIRRFVADRTRMLAAISHDLRTPITRLRLRVEAVEDPDQRAKMIADLTTMEQMIGSALAFIRAESEGEAVERLDLPALLQTCCDERVDMGQDASYEGPSGVICRCRPHALARAVGNLIDNAVRFGGSARVALRIIEPDRAEITVSDSGPGIPHSEREAVFEPFHRLDDARRADTGGIGLGLAIARTIIREHGGDIRLEDNRPKGLRARVILPMRTESRMAARRQEA